MSSDEAVTSAANAAPYESTGVQSSPAALAPYRWLRPLAMLAVGFVVVAAFQTEPRPGAHGQHLGVTIALLALGVSTLGIRRLNMLGDNTQLALLLTATVASAVLVGLQPGGPGFLGVFPAVSGAALRFAPRRSAIVVAVAVAALAIAWGLAGDRPLEGVLMNELGVVAFFAVSMFARRLRESNDRAHRLIAQLEETRAAQAQAAALAERQRLAREMHDVLAHSLSGLVLNLEGARLLAEREQSVSTLTQAIERAQRLAKTGLQEARRAIGLLRDDELPGPQRLAALTAEFQADSGITCTLAVSGVEREIDADGRVTLYRVAQEALTNIRKHAHAERVDVSLAYEEGGTRLTIEDWETGDSAVLRTDELSGAGYGLTGMRERAALLGGTLLAERTATGFRVELWVPV